MLSEGTFQANHFGHKIEKKKFSFGNTYDKNITGRSRILPK
jgi:hypothetical protein